MGSKDLTLSNDLRIFVLNYEDRTRVVLANVPNNYTRPGFLEYM